MQTFFTRSRFTSGRLVTWLILKTVRRMTVDICLTLNGVTQRWNGRRRLGSPGRIKLREKYLWNLFSWILTGAQFLCQNKGVVHVSKASLPSSWWSNKSISLEIARVYVRYNSLFVGVPYRSLLIASSTKQPSDYLVCYLEMPYWNIRKHANKRPCFRCFILPR